MRIVVIRSKKWIGSFFLVLGLVLLAVGLTKFPRAVVSRATMKSPVVIAIDPGHGGFDPGAIGTSGEGEKNINLAIALKLKHLIESTGGEIIMTRESDVGLCGSEGSIRQRKNEDLNNRKKILNNTDADAFISIHLNSFKQDASVKGAQVFYIGNNEASQAIATSIQKEICEIADPTNKRVAHAIKDVYIMKDCSIPGVIVECGFLSNAAEEHLLQSEEYQEKMAWAIFSGIYQYMFGEGGSNAQYTRGKLAYASRGNH